MRLQDISEHIENILLDDYHITRDQLLDNDIGSFMDDYFFREFTYKIEKYIGVDLSVLFDRMGILIDKDLFNFDRLCQVIHIIKNRTGFCLYLCSNAVFSRGTKVKGIFEDKIELIYTSFSHNLKSKFYQNVGGFYFKNKQIQNVGFVITSDMEEQYNRRKRLRKKLPHNKKIKFISSENLFKSNNILFIKTTYGYFTLNMDSESNDVNNVIQQINKKEFLEFYQRRERCDVILKNKKPEKVEVSLT